MRSSGGREARSAAGAALWLLLIATACGFVVVVLNLPDDHARSGPGAERAGGTQLPVKERMQNSGEFTRLNAVAEEIEGQNDEMAAEEDERISRSSPGTKEKIWMMQDQLIMAKAYLQFASRNGSAHLVRELKLRMKEIERAISQSSGGSHVPGRK